jgi:apolipoprotein D and lipocalin family protein
MRYFIIILFSTFLFSNTPPTPVPHVDINKFSGLWYEIARTYNKYEKDCVAATVEYDLQEDNTYKIYNRCFKNEIGGDLIEYKGTAEPVNGHSMSKIDMTYFYFFTSEYRVIHLENDYSAAVVADKDMKQVWVMSRKPNLPKSKFDNILAKLEKNMDLQRLIYTPQDKKGRYK